MKIKKLSALTLAMVIFANTMPVQAMNDKDVSNEEPNIVLEEINTQEKVILKNEELETDEKIVEENQLLTEENTSTEQSMETSKYYARFSITYYDGQNLLCIQEVVKDSIPTKFKDPTKNGYAFNGWFLDKDLTKPYSFDKLVTENLTLYSKWTKTSIDANNPCIVSFIYDDNRIEKQTVKFGEKAIKPADPIKSGYKFIGWFGGPSLSRTIFDFNKAITKGGEIKLTAMWSQENYVISFNTNGGNSISPISFLSIKNIVSPTKTDYKFAGWYLDKNLTTPFIQDKTKITSNITLYAKWEKLPSSYTVVFDTNGGETISPIKSSLLPKMFSPTKTDYKFVGWYLDKNLINPFILNKTKITSDITLYAKWEKEKIISKVYTVSFVYENGKIEKQTVSIGSKVRKPADPVKMDYNFIGWYSDQSSNPFDFNKTIKKGGEIKLTPMWIKSKDKSYTVSFNTNGGSSIKSIEVLAGKSVMIPIKPIKNGYRFDGWYTSNNPGNLYQLSNPVYRNFMLNAKWVKI